MNFTHYPTIKCRQSYIAQYALQALVYQWGGRAAASGSLLWSASVEAALPGPSIGIDTEHKEVINP